MFRSFFFISAVILSASLSWGGWFEDAVKGATENLGNRAVHETGDAVYDGAKSNIVSPKKDRSRKNEETSGNKSREDVNRPSLKSQDQRNVSKSAPNEGIEISTENEKIYSKYDFIPGDKVIFFDDFSDTDEGEFPRKWTLKGPGGGGNSLEVVTYKDRKFLRSRPGKDRQDNSREYIRLSDKGDLPEKFTLEFDAYMGTAEGGSTIFYVPAFINDESSVAYHNSSPNGSLLFTGEIGSSENSNTNINMLDNRVHHIAISVNGTFTKAYVDNVRVVNDPDAITRPIKYVGILMGTITNEQSENVMITNVRLAEGGKDIASALDTDGKIITHGILFDTGSDKIKPESQPTLKSILALLENDPALKFSIEGHTDNQGGKGINQPLSERRATAVKNWMTGKGIDSARLKCKGLGDTKPLSDNKSAEGRANNRRVEFIKF